MEDPQDVWPPVGVGPDVDPGHLEDAGHTELDPGPRVQRPGREESAPDPVGDQHRRKRVEDGVATVRPHRLRDAEGGVESLHAVRRVEVERERLVVQRLGEGPGHRGQDHEDIERGALPPSHLDGDGEQDDGQRPADEGQDVLASQVQIVLSYDDRRGGHRALRLSPYWGGHAGQPVVRPPGPEAARRGAVVSCRSARASLCELVGCEQELTDIGAGLVRVQWLEQ